jgi:hypothetical protein
MKLKGKYGALVPDVTVHDVALDGQHAAGGLAVGCHTCEMDVQGGGSIVGYKQTQTLLRVLCRPQIIQKKIQIVRIFESLRRHTRREEEE